MIIRAEPLASTKIGGAHLMFPDHALDSALPKQRHIKPAAETAIPQHNVSFLQQGMEGTEKTNFPRLLAFVLAQRCLQHCAHRQREDRDHSSNGKTAARLL